MTRIVQHNGHNIVDGVFQPKDFQLDGRLNLEGCTALIPPKAFFPEGERDQLLTVRSCPHHNNAKSNDDLYVLAHICMNASVP